MSNLNKLPVTTESSTSTPQMPVKRTQGNHQILFSSKPTPQPPVVTGAKAKQPQDPSVLRATTATSNLLSDSDEEFLALDEQQLQPTQPQAPAPAPAPQQAPAPAPAPQQAPAPAPAPQVPQQTQPPPQAPAPQQTHQRRRGNRKNEDPAKKLTNPSAHGGSAGLKSVLKAIATGGLNVLDFVEKTDNKGTKWLRREPTYKLTDIPTDAKHNEVEFVNWVRIERDFVIYQLFNARGEKYWSTQAAVRWLDMAAQQGMTPETYSFMVKNTKDAGLVYGFRPKESAKDSAKNPTMDVD